jgi:hypothetical protein
LNFGLSGTGELRTGTTGSTALHALSATMNFADSDHNDTIASL